MLVEDKASNTKSNNGVNNDIAIDALPSVDAPLRAEQFNRYYSHQHKQEFLSKNGRLMPYAQIGQLFGGTGRNHYAYPFKGWAVETMPWTKLHGYLGICLNVPVEQLEAACKRLRAAGFTMARVDVGWGNGRYDAPDELKDATKAWLAKFASACKKHKLRPMITIDSNGALPCPAIEASVTLTNLLVAGQKVVTVRTRGAHEVPVAYKCGLSHVQGYIAAEWLVTDVLKIGENTYSLLLGKATPEGYGKEAGDDLPFAYLAFPPFGRGDVNYGGTPGAGIVRFSLGVCGYLNTLGLRKSKDDPGFDMELCNELSNWQFMFMERYTGNPEDGAGDYWKLYADFVHAVRSVPGYKGMYLVNGFHNQAAQGAASTEPAGSSAIGHHYYRSAVPADTRDIENAFGQTVDENWRPIKPHLPQYTVHSYTTPWSREVIEHLGFRTMPYKVEMWNVASGRGVRPLSVPGDLSSPPLTEPDGSPARPVGLCSTEWGDATDTSLPDAVQEHLRTKFVLGGTVLGCGNGQDRQYWFAAEGEGFALLRPEPLQILTRLMAATKGKVITRPRQLNIISVEETHGHVQFKGNGTPEFPDLRSLDCVIIKCFQLTDTSFAVFAWVAPKDYKPDLPEMEYEITIGGLNTTSRSGFTCRDLWKTRAGKVGSEPVSDTVERIFAKLTDVPRLFLLKEV